MKNKQREEHQSNIQDKGKIPSLSSKWVMNEIGFSHLIIDLSPDSTATCCLAFLWKVASYNCTFVHSIWRLQLIISEAQQRNGTGSLFQKYLILS